MKNKRMWLLMVLGLGLVGCKNGNVENENSANNTNDIIKTDTALVLHHNDGSYITEPYNVLCNKDGEVYTDFSYSVGQEERSFVVAGRSIRSITNTGDTVIVARDKKKPYIIRNLTMENKIKAFSKHR